MTRHLQLLHEFGLKIAHQLALELVSHVLGECIKVLSQCGEAQDLTDVPQRCDLCSCDRLNEPVAVAEFQEEDELSAC